ncbi:hypothetical protein A2303_05940 [Candidatus Falkowbacteria bacterium RIFOXYB2_FULL_47_14]|uniref:Uncharacterized protein n=1 Tax=Candidatus Falkowbacteria bacterium RIFOXYA2_FULL_47_19 TaxID=1797994 RepID=A0A1F5SMH7_9BACT|nr:MAG: hypothetical protein A2227_04720 [Candidatus Falkowbacteria bacterium RIFOXYA2_FULL_47_19]OGF42759.1 MAG: hypothetical protein A2303_05940 [Candidatus Falkowbacteria bacterium RIFOXYB2_FULL_47_14]
MPNVNKQEKTQKGFTLMELIITIGVISILTLGVYSLIIISLRITADNKNYVSAIEIADQKMEQIRNMPFSDVGVVSGIPPGTIPQIETVVRDKDFTVNTYVTFYDDDYDGLAGSTTPDTIPNDYKIATVKVSWDSNYGHKDITVFSKIIPRTEETSAGYGLLKLYVVDSNALPVTAADIRVVNAGLGIDVTNVTDSSGILYLPAPESFQDYEITVTKAGYGTDYSFDLLSGLTPLHLSVTEGDKTEESFSIDKLALLDITTYSDVTPSNWLIYPATSTIEKTGSKMAADGSGNIYFVWQESDISTSSVYAQKFNSGNTRQWADKIEISDTPNQSHPDITVANDGTSFVVWQDSSVVLKQTTLNKPSKRYAKYLSPVNLAIANQKTANIYENLTQKFIGIFNDFKFSKNTVFEFINGFSARRAKAATGNVTFVDAWGTATGNTWNITLNVPALTQENDLLIAYVHHDRWTDGPILPPAGWSTLDDDIHPNGAEDDHRGGLFYKIAGNSEPANYTFTMRDGSDEKAGHIRVYRGVDQVNPFDGSLVETNTDDGDKLRPAPSHAVTTDGSMLLCGWGSETRTLGDGGPTFPAGMLNPRNDFADYITAASADEEVDIADSPTGVRNYDANKNVSSDSFNWCIVLRPEIIPDNITVAGIGNQTTSITIPNINEYSGGAFAFTDNTGAHTITSISVSEKGTVDAQNNLSNVKLFYDIDGTAPYDCADETYNTGMDAQFGAAQNFDAADGTAVFASSVNIDTTHTMCAYLVFDVEPTAGKDDTVEVEITNPPTDVTVNSGSVIPNTAVTIPGATDLLTSADLQQMHYRFRDDDGDEASATWIAPQDMGILLKQNSPIRLRVEISNEGSLDSSPSDFRIEYGVKNTTCDAIAAWTALPTNDSLHWKISASANITDADPTTNSSGISDENIGFIPGEIKDTGNQTSAIVLTGTQFTEIEYSIEATNNALESTYCFRLTDAGATTEFSYPLYPEIAIIGDDNIYIKSLNNDGTENWSTVKVNADMSDANQRFPRIAITENFGNATTTIVWEDDRNGHTDIYAQCFNGNGARQWTNDLRITSSLTDEETPVVAIDSGDNIYVAWTEQDDIYMQKFDLAGNELWAGHKNLTNSAVADLAPEISIDAADNIIVTWTSQGVSDDIYLASFDPTGAELWKKIANVEEPNENQAYSDVFADNANIYLVWADDRLGDNDIYSQKYDFSGNAQWTDDQKISDAPSGSSQTSPGIAVSSDSHLFSSWHDGRWGVGEIYATHFENPGAAVPIANIPLVITGTKKIYNNPVIYEFDQTHTSDINGKISVQLEWDTAYSIVASSTLTAFTVQGCQPDPCPIAIDPDEFKSINVYVE